MAKDPKPDLGVYNSTTNKLYLYCNIVSYRNTVSLSLLSCELALLLYVECYYGIIIVIIVECLFCLCHYQPVEAYTLSQIFRVDNQFSAQSCKSGRAFRVGFGPKVDKNFGLN